MVQRVVVHVGCPKTGTSAIQHVLATNPEALAAQGFFYPTSPDGFEQHYAATRDLYGNPIDPEGPLGPGAWDRLAAEVVAWDGTAIVSHELLASASPEQAKRAVESFGGADVQIVITARDLARQVPSGWQEHVKHGFPGTMDEFIAGINGPERGADRAIFVRRFWAVQDLPHVAMRWASAVGPQNVTIVTVPASRTGATSLESRFGEAIGLDVSKLNHDQDRRNSSMGIAETEVIRRFNEGFAAAIPELAYHEVIREQVVRLDLGPHRKSPPLRLPPDQVGWVQERARSWVEAVEAAGYRVVGDLQELVPADISTEPLDEINGSDVLDAAIRALGGAVVAYAAVRDELEEERLKPTRLGEMKRRLLRR